MLKRVVYFIFGLGLLLIFSVYVFTDVTGRAVFPSILLPITAIVALVTTFYFIRQGSESLKRDNFEIADLQNSKQRSRFLTYVASGLALFCIILLGFSRILFVRGAPAWSIVFTLLTAAASLFTSAVIIILRLLKWWMRYIARIYRQ